jgi:hypothetical protein
VRAVAAIAADCQLTEIGENEIARTNVHSEER